MARSDLPRYLLVGGDGGLSGVPRYIHQMARALRRQAQITVMSDENHGGYDFVTVQGLPYLEQSGLRSSLSPLKALRAARALRAALTSGDYDLVWGHARMAVLLLRIVLITMRSPPRARVALTYHGLPFGPGHRRGVSALSRWVEWALLRASPPLDLVFLSPAAEARFSRAIGPRAMARHCVHVLENCSDLDPLPPVPDPTRLSIVMTGRTGRQKNFNAGVELFRHMPDDVHLTICGTGTDWPKFREGVTKRLGEDQRQRLHFAGPLRDIRPTLARADLYLSTARYEGMPIGVLEAFEAGLPLALSDIAGHAEILACHPAALPLPLQNMAQEAARIVAFARAQKADPTANETIRAAWRSRLSFEIWSDRLRRLCDGIAKP